MQVSWSRVGVLEHRRLTPTLRQPLIVCGKCCGIWCISWHDMPGLPGHRFNGIQAMTEFFERPLCDSNTRPTA